MFISISTGISLWSTGRRAPVPSAQIRFWEQWAWHIIQAFANWFTRHCTAGGITSAALSAGGAWGPNRDHLQDSVQEQVTPPHILDMLTALCARFVEWQPSPSEGAHQQLEAFTETSAQHEQLSARQPCSDQPVLPRPASEPAAADHVCAPPLPPPPLPQPDLRSQAAHGEVAQSRQEAHGSDLEGTLFVSLTGRV